MHLQWNDSVRSPAPGREEPLELGDRGTPEGVIKKNYVARLASLNDVHKLDAFKVLAAVA